MVGVGVRCLPIASKAPRFAKGRGRGGKHGARGGRHGPRRGEWAPKSCHLMRVHRRERCVVAYWMDASPSCVPARIPPTTGFEAPLIGERRRSKWWDRRRRGSCTSGGLDATTLQSSSRRMPMRWSGVSSSVGAGVLRERPGRGRGASLGRFFAGGRGAATSAIDHFGLLWSFGNAGHGPTATHLSKLVDFGRSRDGEEDQRTPESWMIGPPADFGSAHVVFDAARQAHTFGARPAPALSASCRPKSPKVGRGASDRSKCTRTHTHRWTQRPQHQHS